MFVLNSSKKNTLQNMWDTDEAEIQEKFPDLMHVLENSVWKSTDVPLTQILLHRKTCCPAVDSTVSRQSLSVNSITICLSHRELPTLRPGPHLITTWRRGLTVQSNAENQVRTAFSRVSHQVGSDLFSLHHSLASPYLLILRN